MLQEEYIVYEERDGIYQLSVKYEYTYEYDENGYLVKEIQNSSNGDEIVIIYENDAQGNIQKEINYINGKKV